VLPTRPARFRRGIALDGLRTTAQNHSMKLLACVVLLSLAIGDLLGENPPPDPALCGPFPKLYKEIIWNWMQTSLVDANSAKIEWEGEPTPADLGTDGQHLYGWLVKFGVNARNRFGTYTGKQSHGALIRDGQVVKGIGIGY
jgi:hypothetical protein